MMLMVQASSGTTTSKKNNGSSNKKQGEVHQKKARCIRRRQHTEGQCMIFALQANKS